jgi:hypothetical protein
MAHTNKYIAFALQNVSNGIFFSFFSFFFLITPEPTGTRTQLQACSSYNSTHYVQLFPAVNFFFVFYLAGTHFQLGRLKQLGVESLAQGLNMMAPGEVRTHDPSVTRRTLTMPPDEVSDK